MVLRVLAHLLSVALLVPQTLVFAAVVLLDHVIAKRTFAGFVTAALDTLDLLFGWGGIALLLVVALVIGAGFRDRWRPAASSFLLVFDLVSVVSIVVWSGVRTFADVFFLLLPGSLAAG